MAEKIIRDGIKKHPIGLRSLQNKLAEVASKHLTDAKYILQNIANIPVTPIQNVKQLTQSESLNVLTQRKRCSYTSS
jgi:hypothetical protein